MSPNTIYSQPQTRGGVEVDLGNAVKIFYDYKKIVTVRQGVVRISKRTLFSKLRKDYLIEDNELSIRTCRGKVRVRGILRDQRAVYLYDQKTDQFLGIAKQKLEPFGDLDSMGENDKKMIMGHSSKVKAQKKLIKARSEMLDQEINLLEASHIDLQSIDFKGK